VLASFCRKTPYFRKRRLNLNENFHENTRLEGILDVMHDANSGDFQTTNQVRMRGGVVMDTPRLWRDRSQQNERDQAASF